jgi:hypothetical protein
MNWKKFWTKNKYKLLFLVLTVPSLILLLAAVFTPTPLTFEGKTEYVYNSLFTEHYIKELIGTIIFAIFIYVLLFKIKATKTFFEPTKSKILILVIISVLWLIYHCDSIKSLCIAILPFNLISVTFSLFSDFYHIVYQYAGVWPPEMSVLAILSFFIYFLSSLLVWIYHNGRKNIYLSSLLLDFRKLILFFLINDFFMLSTIQIALDLPMKVGFPLIFLVEGGLGSEGYFSVTNLLFDFVFWYACSFLIIWFYDKIRGRK